MSENWIYDQLRDKTIAAHNGDLGVLSTSEHLAAALVLNRPDWLEDAGYTMVGAITRVGTPESFTAGFAKSAWIAPAMGRTPCGGPKPP